MLSVSESCELGSSFKDRQKPDVSFSIVLADVGTNKSFNSVRLLSQITMSDILKLGELFFGEAELNKNKFVVLL